MGVSAITSFTIRKTLPTNRWFKLRNRRMLYFSLKEKKS